MSARGPEAGAPESAPALLILVGMLGYGGAENQVSLLAAGLRARGVRAHLACFDAEPGREREMAAAGVPIHRLPVGGRLWWPARILPRILEITRRERIRIVQAFLPTFDILAPWLRLWRPGLRVVTSRRNLDDVLSAREVRLLRAGLALAHRVVANSEAVAESVRARESLDGPKLRVIPNGIPLPPAIGKAEREASRRALGFAEGELVVLYLAHFRAAKGHGHLPAVIRDTLRLEPRARFLVVGDMDSTAGYRRHAERFREAVDSMGLAPAVRSPGMIRETRGLFAAADLCLNLSDAEGMSNVIMEAMASGVPVVATETGAARELLGETGAGALVARGDTGAASSRVAALSADPGERRRMGEAGRDAIAGRYSVEAMVDAYVRLYRELM